MPRRDLVFVPGHCYHVYNRGCDRQPIFFEKENYLFFLRELKIRCHAGHIEVLAWCLMPNHYHLIVVPHALSFAAIMQSFGTAYVKGVNQRRQRTGTLFEGRFRAIQVEEREYALHLSRYVHLNPVAAGLVDRPQDYAFSSYLDYLGLRQGTLAQPHRILSEFPSVEDYRLFVESGISRIDNQLRGLMFDEE